MGVLNVSEESPYDPSVFDDPGEAAACVDDELVGEFARHADRAGVKDEPTTAVSHVYEVSGGDAETLTDLQAAAGSTGCELFVGTGDEGKGAGDTNDTESSHAAWRTLLAGSEAALARAVERTSLSVGSGA